MKVILACSSDYMAIPAALKLKSAGMLSCIVIPAKHKKRLFQNFISAGIDSEIIHTVTKENLVTELTSLVQQYKAESIFVITFPWIIPQNVLSAPINGCINFHPGLLPKYKGADPIFWQLRNQEVHGGFTVHRMTEQVDEGPILLLQKMPVIPGETYGIHVVRLGALAAEIIMQVVTLIENETTPVQQADEGPALFFSRPDKEQVTIDWQKQTAAEIDALVNAGNPKYNGAFTRIRHMELTVLEVGFADFNNVPAETQPGTIVYADGLYGPIVACADGKFVKINAVCIPEGYISGSKLFSLGFGVGEKFI